MAVGDELSVVASHLLAWAEVARMAGEDGCNPEAVMRVASGREPDEG